MISDTSTESGWRLGALDRWALTAFLVLALVLAVVAAASLQWLPFAGLRPPSDLPRPWLEGWYRWDGGWYVSIAESGYQYFGPHRQASVAFFPGYPFAIRVASFVVGDPALTGILITFCAGAVVALLFVRWSKLLLGEEIARAALLALLLYPFGFYLVGAVYADALYLAAALGAFVLLEQGRPGAAGIVGIVATATRPVGAALTVALVLRAWEKYGNGPAAGPSESASSPKRVSLAMLATSVSCLGAVAYALLLWFRFGDPIAFARVADAPGWGHRWSWATVLKRPAFELLGDMAFDVTHTRVLIQGLVTLAALALTASVIRRLNWSYGVYCFLVVAVPAVTTPQFIGLGRYVLAAFPCFAVLGLRLAAYSRPARFAAFAASGLLLMVLTSLYARGAYLS